MTRRSFKKKRNRKRTLHAKRSWHTVSFAGMVFLAVGLALFYGAYINKNTTLQQDLNTKQAELGRLTEQCLRAESRWNALKSKDNLQRAMGRHGIEMEPPQAHQIVKMGKDGLPIQNQHSVEWYAKNRSERERGNVVKTNVDR
ncbi:MAG: hypothetical protein PHO37_07955 [Kiritimatiellae bacterium]|nr:hypothetical protein [Kiritimatiellia bacterium]